MTNSFFHFALSSLNLYFGLVTGSEINLALALFCFGIGINESIKEERSI